MKKNVCLVLLILAVWLSCVAQAPNCAWANQVSSAGQEYGRSVCSDADGNVFTFGTFTETVVLNDFTLTSAGEEDLFVAKYDSDGALIWAVSAGGALEDEASSIVADSNGNVVITGNFEDECTIGSTTLTSAGGTDIYVAKLDSDGAWLWAESAGGGANDTSTDIGIDAYNSTYVTGSFYGGASFGNHSVVSAGGKDVYVAKIVSSGSWDWATQGGGAGTDVAHGISNMDTMGRISVIGHFKGTSVFGDSTLVSIGGDDIFIAQINYNGDWQWAVQAGGTFVPFVGGSDRGFGVTVDNENNIYATGYFIDEASFGPFTLTYTGPHVEIQCGYVTKLSGEGVWQWAVMAAPKVQLYKVCADNSGACFVSGCFNAIDPLYPLVIGDETFISEGMDILVASVNNIGEWQWAKQFGSPYFQKSEDICLDSDSNVIFTGNFIDAPLLNFGLHSVSNQGGTDCFTVKLSDDAPQGAELNGMVSLDGGFGDVTDVTITCGNQSVNPDETGQYSMHVLPGVYTVTAALYHYQLTTIENVELIEAQTETVNITLVYEPIHASPDSLNAVVYNDVNVDLSWNQPQGTYGCLKHHTGYGGWGDSFGNEYQCACRFTPTELQDFYGNCLSNIRIMISSDAFSQITVKVWEGGSYGDPGTEIYSQEITDSVVVNSWTNHELDIPIQLVSDNEYWIGYEVTGVSGDVTGIDFGPCVDGKGNWCKYPDTSWERVQNIFNWCIEGVVGNNPTSSEDSSVMKLKPKCNFKYGSDQSRTIDGFNVYRNSVLINTINDVTTTCYSDEELSPGDYEYYVTAVYDGVESEPSNIATITITPPQTNPPSNLCVTGEYNDRTLTWEQPVGTTAKLYHHTGYTGNAVGTNEEDTISCAARFDADDLISYYGNDLTEIQIFIVCNEFSGVTVKIWEGTGTPQNELYSSDITSSVQIEEWTTHALTAPVSLVSGNEYWVGFEINATGGYPVGLDGGPYVQDKGSWIKTDSNWSQLPDLNPNALFNFCIEASVLITEENVDITRDIQGYKIYRDDEEIYEITDYTITTYNDSDLAPGDYSYYVTAVYDEGESDASNVALTTVELFSPEEFTATSQGANGTIMCTWSAPNQSRAISGYNVYRDDEVIGNTSSLFYPDINVPSGEYTYWVTAVYSDDYESEPSNSVVLQHTSVSIPLVPEITELCGNYPNPFNPSTDIQFNLSEPQNVVIEIYNIKGEMVKRLVDKQMEAASHSVTWDGKDSFGEDVSSGIYFYKMQAGTYGVTKKMILVK